MKKILFLIGIILIVLAGNKYFTDNKIKISSIRATDYKNATYSIEGKLITLKNGLSEIEVSQGSASKIITQYFGNEVRHDFDGDGREDVAFIVSQNTGGSGTFYYVLAALNKADGYVGSEGVLLGDRIAPQTTEMGNGNVVIVNYTDRAFGESFAVQPSVGKSIWLLLDSKTMQFSEVAQNFEGEVDPARMNLNMKTWNWINTEYKDSKNIWPKIEKKFTITFDNKNTFSATTDCNGMGGDYSVGGNKITFDKMFATQMYCEGSQEGDFTKMLEEVENFSFTSKGELIFSLNNGVGSFIFK